MRLVYIVGCGHSGTTLLSRLLGAHPQVVTVGGLRHLAAAARGDRSCSCGAANLVDCPFWSSVDGVLARDGFALNDLDTRSPDAADFESANRAVLRAVLEVSGASVVVDSSREIARLRRLRGVDGLDVFPVHLIKDPRAQFRSHTRRGRSGYRGMRNYVETNLRAIRVLTRDFQDYAVVTYESLTDDPAGSIAGLVGWLGLDPQPGLVSSWGEEKLHVFGGNRMLRDSSSKIMPDRRWEDELTLPARIWSLSTGGPVYRWARSNEGFVQRHAVATSGRQDQQAEL